MAERGILFSAPMVQAILAGRKTVTRRVVKPRAKVCAACLAAGVPHNGDEAVLADGPYLRIAYCDHNEAGGERTTCPYGVAGDTLWVRETWRLAPSSSRSTAVQYRANDGMQRVPGHVTGDEVDRWLAHRGYVYIDGHGYRCIEAKREQRWSPAIHMPRWASRITLDVVSVRVERLHDIDEADALREGINVATTDQGVIDTDGREYPSARDAFRQLWNDTYGPGSWDANPWVWRIAFEVRRG